MNEKIIYFILGILVSIFIFSFILFFLKKQDEKNMELERIEKEKKMELERKIEEERRIKKEELKTKFIKSGLRTEAYYIYNLDNNEIIFSKNEKIKYPIASLTKIINLATALDLYSLKDRIKINEKNLMELEDNGLILDEEFVFSDLIDFMMITSSNDAANAFTNRFGIRDYLKKMNEKATSLEMYSSIFFTESGLDLINGRVAGGYSSAEDLSKLIIYLYKKYPKIINSFSEAEKEICSNLKCHSIINTNKIIFDENQKTYVEIDGEKIEVIFTKTGYTEMAGGALAMIVKIENRRFLIIILKSTEDERFEDMKKIIKILKDEN